MKTYEVRVKNINDEIVTMAIEEESLSAAQSKCREIGLEVLDDNNKNCERYWLSEDVGSLERVCQ